MITTTVSRHLVRAAHRPRAHPPAKGFFLRSVHLRRDRQKFLNTRMARPDHAKGMFGILKFLSYEISNSTLDTIDKSWIHHALRNKTERETTYVKLIELTTIMTCYSYSNTHTKTLLIVAIYLNWAETSSLGKHPGDLRQVRHSQDRDVAPAE